jgi:hypothetical protein
MQLNIQASSEWAGTCDWTNTLLIFEIELMEIVKNPAGANAGAPSAAGAPKGTVR